jgi:serine protease Do
LINLRGEVIGMNTAIASSSGGNEGIGFTIPIKLVNVISHQLVEHGHVVRGRLGIGLDKTFGSTGTATPVGLQPPRGARINEIFPHGTAAAAKLEVGDIILNFDGVPVESHQHLINLVGPTEVGRDVPVTISRGGKRMNFVVRIGSETSSQAAPAK